MKAFDALQLFERAERAETVAMAHDSLGGSATYTRKSGEFFGPSAVDWHRSYGRAALGLLQ